MRSTLPKVECLLALLVTLLAVYPHLVFFQHSGGFWRDEVGTINLAARPGLSAVWSYLLYDSFPAFWVMVVRAWLWLGLGSDVGLRVLGLLVGLSVLGALWFNARSLKISWPFFSLLLLGLNSTIFIWGDSMRAWGWGMLWILMTLALVWRVVESPTRLNVPAATVAAISAVHSTYYNWILLFAICTSGALIALHHRLWKRGGLTLGIGAVAAISVVPYVIGIHRLRGHYLAAQIHFGLKEFVSKSLMALSGGASTGEFVWVLLLLAAVVIAIICQIRPATLNVASAQKDLLLFAVSIVVLGSVGYFLFLKNLKFATQPWYYSALMAVVAISIDAIFSVLGNSDSGRKLRLISVVAVVALLAPSAWKSAPVRMTNTDLIAKALDKSASKDDLIVVNPWYCGIGFQYYYSGATPWTTLPAIRDHSFHCYDEVVQLMMKNDQMQVVQDVLVRVSETLKAGNRVWLVGGLTYLPPGRVPVPLPAAPNGPSGWWSTPYQELWSMEASYFVQSHAAHHKDIVIAPDTGSVNPAEYLPLTMLQGWREK